MVLLAPDLQSEMIEVVLVVGSLHLIDRAINFFRFIIDHFFRVVIAIGEVISIIMLILYQEFATLMISDHWYVLVFLVDHFVVRLKIIVVGYVSLGHDCIVWRSHDLVSVYVHGHSLTCSVLVVLSRATTEEKWIERTGHREQFLIGVVLGFNLRTSALC